MQLNDVLEKALNKCLEFQAMDGSFPSGHNGPYMDSESPVRNTAHMLFLLSRFYQITKNRKYKKSADKALDYLLSEDSRPMNITFYHRDKIGKDKCNGLVGQAWCIEALVIASDALDRPESYQLAEEVYKLHLFDEDVGLWHRRDIDGRMLSFDSTFNHQLWFAASAAMLKNTPEALRNVTTFLDKIAMNVNIYPNGVIYHTSPMGRIFDYAKLGFLPFLKELKSRLGKSLPSRKSSLYSKSVGYHGFNMYAFAMLKEYLPDNIIWQSDLIRRLLEPCETKSFQQDLKESEFGYFYNVSGIELAYAFEKLTNDTDKACNWLKRQFDFTLLSVDEPLIRNVKDVNTARARIYAAVRIKNNYDFLLDD